MAQEHVEIVRGIFERLSEGDLKSHFELFDEHVVVILPPELPDTGIYVGHEAVLSYTRGFLEPWERLTMEAEELIDAGDTVVVAVCQRAAGEASGAVTELRYFQLWTFRGEKVIRLESIREREDALRAAGLAQ